MIGMAVSIHDDQRQTGQSPDEVMQFRDDHAVDAYDRAVGLVAVPERGSWGLFYARAICHERLEQWDKAKA